MRGNYSDGNGTDHVLATGSPGTAWTLEYSIGFGAFLSSIDKCAADCVYKLTAYTKVYNETDTRTLMKLIDPSSLSIPGIGDSTAFGTAYKTEFSPTSTMYCARQSGYCGAVTPIYLYYNNVTDDYVTRGTSTPNGTEEDPDSVIANGGQPWCYLFQPPTTTTTTVSTTTGPTRSTTTVSTTTGPSTTTSTVSTTSGSSTSSASSTTTTSGSSTTTSPVSSSTTTTRTTTTAMTTTRTPATTTTVSTTTSPYVYNATTDAAGTFAPDDTVLANGTIVRSNGDVVYPNGTVVTADGWTIVGGTKIAPNGTVYNPNGSSTYPNGTTVNSNNSTTYPNGTTVMEDGTAYNPGGIVSYPNGTVAYPNGTTTNTDGSYQAPNGVTYYPNGTQKYEDGTVVAPDGTQTSPDGTVTYPNGTVVAAPTKEKSGGGISLGWPLIIVGVIIGAAVAIGVIYGLTIAFIKSGSRAVSPEQYNNYQQYRRDSGGAMAPPHVVQPAYTAPPPFS